MIRKLATASAAAVLFGLAPAIAVAQAAPPLAATADQLAVMALEAGVWDADITFPSNDPQKPDARAKGVQVNTLRSGGMWMLNRFSVEGTPYEGTGLWGYDRTTGRYSGVWTDNNDHQIRMDHGRWDPAARTMTWTADMPQADGRHMRLLISEVFKGETRTFDIMALTRKGEVPLVKMLFTRRPGSAGTPG